MKQTRVTGPGYQPLWQQIIANGVAINGIGHTVSLCLETAWNTPHGTPADYRDVGASLAAATSDYLGGRVQP
ncbi:hypothetical protein Poly24_38230 [Rosistilla carotiformis]|uniref:Uncharacterized protein n=1 Tax=Rosistilla carotiformis TaxID=2528017 RepID=A0A518JX41_9BACT|nr:hypothetical protein [Rosistilla carotiformis]QDV70104.1 hypothetical protein Poly24_38230 [Rosistilla carotiformis]